MRNIIERTATIQRLRGRSGAGLTLVGVDYPPDDELAARIAVTRDLRTL